VLESETLSFVVYDADVIGSDDFLGMCELDGSSFFPDGFSGDLVLSGGAADDFDGKVLLRVRVTLEEPAIQSFPEEAPTAE